MTRCGCMRVPTHTRTGGRQQLARLRLVRHWVGTWRQGTTRGERQHAEEHVYNIMGHFYERLRPNAFFLAFMLMALLREPMARWDPGAQCDLLPDIVDYIV